VYCKSCETERNASPEARERNRAQKERKRREAGVPRKGEKEYCTNGHLKAENRRPGRSDCAECHRIQERLRAWANGSKPREHRDVHPCSHPREGNTRFVKGKPKDCKQCHRERERNRPHNPETSRLYAQKNRKRLNLYQQAWAAANRPKEADFRRGGPAAIAYAKLISGDPCGFCGGPSGEIDHIVPVTKGGSGEWENLAPICRSCNASKSNKDLLHFMMRRLERRRLPAA
jgi:hypothetical protein